MTQRRGEPPTLTAVRPDSVDLPSVRVVVVGASGVTVEAPLGLEPVVIGTGADCDVVVVDGRVSRRHCRLALTERGVVLRDLGSKNGTFVRDVAIVEVLLDPGVTATLGASRLSLRVDGTPTQVPLSTVPRFGDVLGASVAMRAVFAKLARTAPTDETILLWGESGTGKELLARAIHDASPRRDGPFEVLDCSAVAAGLVEVELFGAVRGAFTGAVARPGVLQRSHGGTLFVDELGELPLDLQPKLLRALETRRVRRVGGSDLESFDARVVVATHRDLRARVADGSFRADLYYRVAVVEVRVPALRDRKEDIPLLVDRFLAEHAPGRTRADLPPNALALLTGHDWPGNVRELRNVVARIVLFHDAGPEVLDAAGPSAGPSLSELTLREARALVVERFERGYIADKLREHGGKVGKAAQAMGVSRQMLHRLLVEYGIDADTSGSA